MEKHLRSASGRKCLTKCQPKGTYFVHPIILSTRIDLVNDICAVEPIYDKNSSGEMEIRYHDKCKIEDNYINDVPNEIETLLLHFYFNTTDFLANVYQINSFDDAVVWSIENDYLPFDTIKRVHNCSWKSFGKKSISVKVFEYYYDIVRTRWMYDYLDKLRKTMSIEIHSESSGSDESMTKLLSLVMPFGSFVKVVNRFVSDNMDTWTAIESHYKELKNYVYNDLRTGIIKYHENIA